jgi:cytochrome P450
VHPNLEQSNLLFFRILTAFISRRPEIFGNDAHLFRPERWLDLENAPSMKGFSNGVFANTYVLGTSARSHDLRWMLLLRFTFSGGPRSCIGYRFA